MPRKFEAIWYIDQLLLPLRPQISVIMLSVLVLEYKMGNHVLCSLSLHMHTYTHTHVEVREESDGCEGELQK